MHNEELVRKLKSPVILIGLPGSGKSSAGRRLANRLQCGFIDTDTWIESRLGCSIRTFFEEQGEFRFREIEHESIAEVLREQPGIVATGGGSVLRPENRDLMRSGGYVVYLSSSVDDLYLRLRHDVKRPLLQVADPRGRLRELFDQRDPLYRQTAHAVIEAGVPSLGALVGSVFDRLASDGIVSRRHA